MKNLELKVKYDNSKALNLVSSLDYQENYTIHQLDTYFNVNKGRLKLREINNSEYELISYSRPDKLDAKSSSYEIYTPSDVDKLKVILTNSLGIKTVVDKVRQVYIYKNCRIHIDEVKELGQFLEFEVVMIPDRTEIEADSLMKFLMEHFEIKEDSLVKVSYSDLIMNVLCQK